MRLRPGVRDYFRLRPRARDEIAAQVDEEIALHIELRVQDLMREGMTEGEARAEAERRFGGLRRSRRRLRRRAEKRERMVIVKEWLAGWGQDFRVSARALMREPLLALMIVLTLGLGIGANATMFGIVDQLMLRGPAHVVAPEQMQRLYVTQHSRERGATTRSSTGYITYSLLRERQDLFAGVSAYRTAVSRIGRGTNARLLPVGWGTADLFPVLGVQPVLGRFFNAEEDRPKQAERVAVLDYGYWKAEYGGARDVLGRSVIVEDEAYTIIGVAAEGFTGPDLRPKALWLPFSTGYEPRPDWPTTWNASWLQVILRLRPDVSIDNVNAEITRIYRAAAPESRTSAREASLTVLPLATGRNGEQPPEMAVTRWLAGVSLIVLVIACANVVNLLLARAVRRRREVAVRLALGVSRARLVRLLLSESMLLAFAGGVLAIAIAYWGGQFLRLTLMPDVQWAAPITLRLLGFNFAAVIISGCAVGLAPALHARSRNLSSALKDATRQAGSSRTRLRASLTVMQAALSLVLLIGAGLFVRSLWNVRHLELGVDADRVLAVWSVFPTPSDLSPEQEAADVARRKLWEAGIVEQLRARTDVANAALAIGTPLQGAMGVELRVPGRDSIPEMPGGGPYIVAATADYFATVGTRIVRGRGFHAHENGNTAPVAVVNETIARTLWPDEDALTKCIIIGGDDAPCSRVIGVAEDVHRFGLRDEPSMQYYVPLGQEVGVSGTQILVRPRGDAQKYIDDLRRQLHAAAPNANFFNIAVLQETLDPQIRPWHLGATMFLVFGGLALLIAAVGLYSLIAYSVAQRRTEIGVRMALGARAATIVRMVLRQGLAHVLAGIALGFVLAFAVAGRIEAMLFDTSPHDAATFVAVAVMLVLVAILATVIPAARAGRTSPSDALRAE